MFLAVDGNTDGVFSDSSVTHTDSAAGSWWMVDLGAVFTIATIDIYNRTDGNMERLGNYNVIILDQNKTQVWSNHQTTYPNPMITVAAGSESGRYVKIQLADTGYLSLAEIQVNVDTMPVTALSHALLPKEHPAHLNGKISYFLSAPSMVTLEMYDVSGKKLGPPVKSFQDAGNHVLDLQRLQRGAGLVVYTLTIGDRVMVDKVIKVH
jgi:F5/8 type C domain